MAEPTREQKIKAILEAQGDFEPKVPKTREEKIKAILNAQNDVESTSGEIKDRLGVPQSTMSKVGDVVLTGLGKLSRGVRSVTAAPTQSAINAAIEGENPFKAFGSQFAENPDLAPTGETIMTKLGVPNKDYEIPITNQSKIVYEDFLRKNQPGWYKALEQSGKVGENLPMTTTLNPARVTGFAEEMVADPVNLIPFVKPGLRGLGRLTEGVANLNEIGAIGKGVKSTKAADVIAQDLAKAGETFAKEVPGQAEKIKEAGAVLKIKPTIGMQSSDFKVRGLESSLEKSPSIAGDLVRQDIDRVRKGMQDFVSQATKSRTQKSALQVGDAIKSGIESKISQTHIPIKGIYEDIEKSLVEIPVKEKSRNAIVSNLHNYADNYLSGTEQSLVKGFADNISRAKTVDQLKTIRSNVLAKIRNKVPSEQIALSPVIEKLDRAIQSNTIRAAAQIEKQGLGGAKAAGENLISTLKTVNKDYKEFINQVGEFSRKSGIKKKIYGVNDFLEALDDIPSEQLADKVFKSNDVRFLQTFQKQFPQEFELLRQSKLKDIFEATLTKSPRGEMVTDYTKFLKELNKLEPETRGVVFGPEFAKELKHEDAFNALNTLVTSFPAPLNPSGTASGIQFQNFFTNPLDQAKEAFRYRVYKGDAEAIKKVLSAPLNVDQKKLMGISAASKVEPALNTNKLKKK